MCYSHRDHLHNFMETNVMKKGGEQNKALYLLQHPTPLCLLLRDVL